MPNPMQPMDDVPCRLMVIADALNTVGGVASVVAAGAALVTVLYARATVVQARTARREAKDAHAEETRHQAQLLEATRMAHEQEMREREKALASEMFLQRLVHLGRVTDLLGEVADVARIEQVQPPPLIEGTPFKLTRTTGMLARLEATIVIFESLGGPPIAKAEQLSKEGRRANTPPMRIVGDAMSALDEITFLAKDNDRLVQPHSTPTEQDQA
jgi:hypothetical protein